MTSPYSPILAIAPVGFYEMLVIILLAAVLVIFTTLPFWFICKKAGFSPRLSLLSLVPLGVIILAFVLAFADWPNLKQGQPRAAS